MPRLPPEIICLILFELSSEDVDEDDAVRRALHRCCLVSKSFLEVARSALYLKTTMAFEGDTTDDTIHPGERTLKRALSLSMYPYLARHIRSISISIDTGSQSTLNPDLVPFALVTALRASPAVRHLALDLSAADEVHQSELERLGEIIRVIEPSLRTFVFAGNEVGIGASTLSSLLRALPTLKVLHLTEFKLEDSTDFPRFNLQELHLASDQSQHPTNTIPFLTSHSTSTLRCLQIDGSAGSSTHYDLSRIHSLKSLDISMDPISHMLTILGTTNAPHLHSVDLGAYSKLSDGLEKIPKHAVCVALRFRIDLAYLAEFLDKTENICWRRLVLPQVPEDSQPLCQEICDAQGIDVDFG